LLQQEVAELNSKLITAVSRPLQDDSAAEWAPYFQAVQRDNSQKIQVFGFGHVCCRARALTQSTLLQELNAAHAIDLRLLQEAKERERSLWEREIDAALAHVKVRAFFVESLRETLLKIKSRVCVFWLCDAL
jgi:hypothetical protein